LVQARWTSRAARAASNAKEASMNAMRLALVALGVALVVATAGGPTSSTGQTQDRPGLTYGGLKDRYAAWLRLAPGRNSIAALQIDWAVAPERCSNQRTYSSVLYAGGEEFLPIRVGAAGRFARTVVDRYTTEGSRYEEHQVVNGTIAEDVARGSIRGRVKIVRPNGRVVRCNFGPQTWRLVD
jgi:hypothetical protein